MQTDLAELKIFKYNVSSKADIQIKKLLAHLPKILVTDWWNEHLLMADQSHWATYLSNAQRVIQLQKLLEDTG